MARYPFEELHRVIPLAVNHAGPYYLDVLMVEHPTERIYGRSNLMTLNGRHGMLTDKDKIQSIADDRRDKLHAALKAMAELNDQELDWAVEYVKSPHYNVRS